MNHITAEQKQDIYVFVLGTCLTETQIVQAFPELYLDENDVGELLLDLNIELCDECGWWCESCEMEIVGNGPVCAPCREGGMV